MVKKSNDILKLVLSIAIAVVLGVVLSFKFFKLDVTEEKRHSLTAQTIEVLENLDETIFFKVYLTGEIPAEYKRLEAAIEEKLDEFRDFSDDMVDYEFINPYQVEDINENKRFWEKLYDNGVKYTNLSFRKNGVKQDLTIFPGALMNYNGKDYPINFLKAGTKAGESQDMINASITNLEYELISKVTQYMRRERPRIAVLEGHGELMDVQLASISNSLNEFYDLERVSLDEYINALTEKIPGMTNRNLLYDAAIVAKPTKSFSKRDQFIIDQFIMNGGKMLWFIDPMAADLDSLINGEQAMSVPQNLGLDNMLFDYGARINNDLIIDYNCLPIEVDAGPMGDKRQKMLVPWFYSPRLFIDSVLKPYHPINKNLNNVMSEFVSSIDTIENDIEKTVLLTSSAISRRLKSPVRVNINVAQFGFEYFENKATLDPYSPVAVLLEGEFTSTFKNRGVADTIINNPDIAYKEMSMPNSMLIVSDGDMIRNDLYPAEGAYRPYPLGYDPIQNSIAYDNTEFIMNAMNYLLNDKAVISLRTRTFKSRLLSKAAVENNKTLIKFMNVGLPIVIVMLFGVAMFVYRKNKFRKATT
ncbi:MAG: gliding motility-associated ABC transporter substrate-binding protein GldG [Flavobacteriales bacterium]